MEDKIWTCACGKKHKIISGQPIRCEGPGHKVYISPAYWENENKKEKPKTDDRLKPSTPFNNKTGQQNLF